MSASHQDVLLQLIRDYQSFNSHEIEYRNVPPSAVEFSRFVRSNRPVVFKSMPFLSLFDHPDTISAWPALRKWKDMDYLREAMGDYVVTVAETPNG
jgi:hypothetical protein